MIPSTSSHPSSRLRKAHSRASSTALESQGVDQSDPGRQSLSRRAMGLAVKLLRSLWRHRISLLVVSLLSLVEIWFHVRSFDIKRPDKNLDLPFSKACVAAETNTLVNGNIVPPDAQQARENAVILMLARNSDLEGAAHAVRSLEEKWNKNFHYPIVFLNDKPWTDAFKTAMKAATASHLTFDTIPEEMWSWPVDEHGRETPSRETSAKAMAKMKAAGLPYADNEAYHHMCRFYSGFFADHPALRSYDWFWRVEPDVSFSCSIPYDPFRQMRRAGKKYGYTLALWEVGATAPSLFRAVAAFKSAHRLATTQTWTAMMDASWATLPLRWLLMARPSLFHSRTSAGDAWNMCHFWSNFEIASLSFFRSDEYRALFADLDSKGGFYAERWGDAPVHSLAAALFLKPEELHHFGDIGYVHPPFQHCPGEGGCHCVCDERAKVPRNICLDRIRSAVVPAPVNQ